MSLIDTRQLYFSYIIAYVLIGLLLYPFYTGFVFAFDGIPAVKAASTALGISFGFVYLVEKYIWTWNLFRIATGIKVPYIHGRWTGYLYSSFSKHQEKHSIVVEFHQTLHRLTVWYYDANAVTRSRLAGFSLHEPEGGPATILCTYYNQAINTSIAKLQSHSGTMELYVEPAGTKIKGVYYNNPHQRKTYGHIELELVDRNLLGTFGGSNGSVRT